MRAVRIKIHGRSFLLPEQYSDNYDFPDYIIENKDNIINRIEAYNAWLPNPLQDMGEVPDLTSSPP